ncbi:SRPBCC family protein [Hymenobacter lapidiphilus]|uniref:SRPBCC family protein n=1 Tax=Hymenobacter lapidiphilus TaxID=2608003 RepID=A0A7Y7PMW3_9BACT|nr:SRPBCC family protein [Hymenobacter lapidiphilus]NVO30738.1 SRPBCC family protein [Hymenobacter lapidiphilus]
MENSENQPPAKEQRNRRPVPTWRTSAWGSAWTSVVGTAMVAGFVGAGLMWVSVGSYESYGISLFCLSPFICSFVAVIINQWRNPAAGRDMWPVVRAVVGVLAVVTSMALLILSRGEGLICVVMALPFALVMALFGVLLGSVVIDLGGGRRPVPLLSVVLLLYPAIQHYEAASPAPAVAQLVTTTVTVNAAPAAVWRALMQPTNYPAASGWFRAGVVYPTRTAFALDSATGQRTLVCHYSQGLARLPVVDWEPERRLTFAVPPPAMPAPMRELSPYPDIHAPHLHGYFQVDSGTFRLRPLPGGRTLLEARTIYRHSIGPQFYWHWWSNYLLNAMHEQVLTTLGHRAESLSAINRTSTPAPLATVELSSSAAGTSATVYSTPNFHE